LVIVKYIALFFCIVAVIAHILTLCYIIKWTKKLFFILVVLIVLELSVLDFFFFDIIRFTKFLLHDPLGFISLFYAASLNFTLNLDDLALLAWRDYSENLANASTWYQYYITIMEYLQQLVSQLCEWSSGVNLYDIFDLGNLIWLFTHAEPYLAAILEHWTALLDVSSRLKKKGSVSFDDIVLLCNIIMSLIASIIVFIPICLFILLYTSATLLQALLFMFSVDAVAAILIAILMFG